MSPAAGLAVPEIAPHLPAGGTVVAVTDDGSDPRFDAVRDAATDLAAAARGRVILFHAIPGQGDVRLRRPTVFIPGLGSGDDRRESGRPARPAASRLRDRLSLLAAAIQGRGVDVAVWLTGRAISAGTAEAAAFSRASLVLMPAEVDRPGVLRRTLDYRATRIGVPLLAVDAAGRLSRVRPLGERPVEDRHRGPEALPAARTPPGLG
jgi:hypothetical protein